MDKLKKIYLVLNDDKIVVDVTETETPHLYCEVEDEVTVEEIKESLQLSSQVLKWENDCLYLVEVIADHDNAVLEDEFVALQKRVAKVEKQVADLSVAIDNLNALLGHEAEIEI